MLGDLIIAEPKALIGFAGRRVIEQTLQEQLPDNFQTAEYLLKHGLVDLVVPRPLLKQALAEMLTFYQEAPLRKPGKIPHGVAGPLSQTQAVNLTSQWSKGELTKGSRLQLAVITRIPPPQHTLHKRSNSSHKKRRGMRPTPGQWSIEKTVSSFGC